MNDNVNHVEKWTKAAEFTQYEVSTHGRVRHNEVLLKKPVGKRGYPCVDIAMYKSASEASRVTGFNRGNICSICRGDTRLKRTNGYEWRFA